MMTFRSLGGSRLTSTTLRVTLAALCALSLADTGLAVEPDSRETGAELPEPPWESRPYVLEASALVISPQIYANVASRWRIGAFVGVGWTYAFRLNEQYEDPTEVLNAGVSVSLRVYRGLGVELSPLRLSVITGTDWAQGYPSGHVKVYLADARVRVASQLTVVRVAEAYGGGSYNLTWVPVLVAVCF